MKASYLYGAGRVLITDPVAERLRLAAAQDAKIITGEDPAQAVIDATDGEGADVVIDAAGCEARGDGPPRGPDPEEGSRRSAWVPVRHRRRLRRPRQGGEKPSCAWRNADFESAMDLMQDEKLDASSWITTMPLADGQRAFRELIDGAGRFKVVLTFWGPSSSTS